MSAASPQGWTNRRWDFRPKHRKATAATWKSGEAKTWSGQPRAHSQYNPLIYSDDAAVEAAEMNCVENGIFIEETDEKRTYYQRLDHIVGVCSGEETEYLFAEWHQGGSVHGRPISIKALRKMGIRP